MHELLAQVLHQRDLSKAGDLFSLSDAEIEADLSEALLLIREIASSQTYLRNDNDQSVVEICVTRVTSAIRETNSIEKHASALVLLLESCLQFKVAPSSPHEQDPPHAKITSDVLSCIFMNHTKPKVMEQALPVAVRFLHHGNCELSHNLVSYLSLVAIDNSSLLAQQLHLIIDSILIHKNHGLVRLLPQIFPQNRGPVFSHISDLLHVLPSCDTSEKTSILQLTELVAQSQPQILQPHIPLMCNYLSSSITATLVLQTFVTMATANAEPFVCHMTKVKGAGEHQVSSLVLAARIYSAVGRLSQSHAHDSTAYLLSQLPNTDTHTQPLLLKEVKVICEVHPEAVMPFMSELLQYSQSGSVSSRRIVHQIQDLCNKCHTSPSLKKTVGSQTDGVVTVISLGQDSQSQFSSSNVTILAPVSNIPSSKNVSTSTREISGQSLQHVADTSRPPVVCQSQAVISSKEYLSSQSIPHSRGSIVPPSLPQHVQPPVLHSRKQVSGSSILQQHPSSAQSGSGIISPAPSTLSSRSSLLHSPPFSQPLPLPGSSQTLTISQVSLPANSARTLSDSNQQVQRHANPAHQTHSHTLNRLNHGHHKQDQVKNSLNQGHRSHQAQNQERPHHSHSTTSSRISIASSATNMASHTNHRSLKADHTNIPSSCAEAISTCSSLLSSSQAKLVNSQTINQTTSSSDAAAGNLTSATVQSTTAAVTMTTASKSATVVSSPAENSSTPTSVQDLLSPVSTISVATTAVPMTTVSVSHGRGSSGNREFTEKSPLSAVSRTANPNLQAQAIPMRDAVQQFCEKHLSKIKTYIDNVGAKLPFPIKATIEERKHKRYCRLHFICLGHSDQCLYNCHFFTMRTKNPRVWIHLVFLATQARSPRAVSQADPSVGNLKATWDRLKTSTGNSFVRLVTSSFPSAKDQDTVLQELHNERYFDVFELNAMEKHWACFICNHPEKTTSLLQDDGLPAIEGQLKEKKGKWKRFKRWKTRYFSLSGATITSNKTGARSETLPVSKIQSVKAVRKGLRDIPKAFEIFTQDESYVFKAKDSEHAEQWMQCIHIAVARTQKHEPVKPVTELNNMVQAWSGANMGRVNQRPRRGKLSDAQTKL